MVGCFSEKINDRWEVGVALSEDGFKQQSFVNGVCTIKGGKHVDYIANQISRHVCARIKEKKSDRKTQFVECRPVHVRLGRWVVTEVRPRHVQGGIQVLYDGNCGQCQQEGAPHCAEEAHWGIEQGVESGQSGCIHQRHESGDHTENE